MERMYVGLYYITGQDLQYLRNDGFIHYVFILLILIPTAYFILLWWKNICIQFLIILYTKNKSLFKLVTLNTINPINFEKQHILNVNHVDSDSSDNEANQDPEDEVRQKDNTDILDRSRINLDDSRVNLNVSQLEDKYKDIVDKEIQVFGSHESHSELEDDSVSL